MKSIFEYIEHETLNIINDYKNFIDYVSIDQKHIHIVYLINNKTFKIIWNFDFFVIREEEQDKTPNIIIKLLNWTKKYDSKTINNIIKSITKDYLTSELNNWLESIKEF